MSKASDTSVPVEPPVPNEQITTSSWRTGKKQVLRRNESWGICRFHKNLCLEGRRLQKMELCVIIPPPLDSVAPGLPKGGADEEGWAKTEHVDSLLATSTDDSL